MIPPPASPAALGEALRGIAGFGPFFVLDTELGQGKWRPVKDAYAAGLAHLVADRAARYGTGETRIAASIVQLGHAARLWSVVLGCAVAHGVVPDLSGLQQEAEGPGLRLAVPRGWHTPEDDALAPLLYRIVMDEHLVPLAVGLRVKVAAGLLHGNAASALAEAARELVRARPDLRQPATDLARRLLDTGDLRGKGAFTGPDLSFRRRTCCLYYRVPGGGKCPDCCLTR
jgi:hypothetical protein